MKRALLAAAAAALLATLGRADPLSSTTKDPVPAKVGPKWKGYALLSLEYVAGPIVASQFWWKHALSRNPLKNVFEQEPYLEDKMWHLWNGENLTDFHYSVLKRYFGRDDPWRAMGMTMLTLTAVELLDASDAKARWGFSVRDQAANICGIGLWYLKHRWPGLVPVDVRVGVRRWDRLWVFANQSWRYPKNFNQPLALTEPHLDKYSVMKAEIIARPRGWWYLGFSASLKHGADGWGIPENLFGITAGFDALRWHANRRPGKLTPAANALGRYFALPTEYTHWFED